MKLRLALATVLSSCLVWAGEVSVTAVTAQQRYPWNGLVDIVVTVQGSADDIAQADWFFVAKNTATKAALPIVHVTQNGADSGSGTAWARKFIWDATADVGEVKIADVALTVDAKILGGVQLWENGPYWAECNVGATKPEGYGYYFWWGDTVGYKREGDTWFSADGAPAENPFAEASNPMWRKNLAEAVGMGYVDGTGRLLPQHDAATTYLGDPWRVPTSEELAALRDKCNHVWTTYNGVKGRLITGKGAYSSRSIFLPAAGFGFSGNKHFANVCRYWSSSPISFGWFSWSFYLTELNGQENGTIYYGMSIRPVR